MRRISLQNPILDAMNSNRNEIYCFCMSEACVQTPVTILVDQLFLSVLIIPFPRESPKHFFSHSTFLL